MIIRTAFEFSAKFKTIGEVIWCTHLNYCMFFSFFTQLVYFVSLFTLCVSNVKYRNRLWYHVAHKQRSKSGREDPYRAHAVASCVSIRPLQYRASAARERSKGGLEGQRTQHPIAQGGKVATNAVMALLVASVLCVCVVSKVG